MAVSRFSRLIVGIEVMWERTWENMQAVADILPAANCYCTDDLTVYSELVWPDCPDYQWGDEGNSEHIISYGKEETHTIESMNANLRHYLGRLKRKSRCFSRCIHALRRAVRLFVWHHNRRQHAIARNPRLKGNLSLVF
jgi:insertion element IS1 protein InsB